LAHYAHITNGIVDNVIVIDAETLALGHWGDPSEWVKTSYNSRGGVHYGQDGQPSGQPHTHFNFAGIGYTWDGVGFAPPQPFASWTKNPSTYLWEAPTPMPTDGKMYNWDEATTSWVEFVAPVIEAPVVESPVETPATPTV
jgi:hypothetical protein